MRRLWSRRMSSRVADVHEKVEYRDKLGPIPPEHWDNDLPFDPNIDTSPGSLYDEIMRRIDKEQARAETSADEPRKRR